MHTAGIIIVVNGKIKKSNKYRKIQHMAIILQGGTVEPWNVTSLTI